MANTTDWLNISQETGGTGVTSLALTALTNDTLSAKTATITAKNTTYNVQDTTTVTIKAFEPTLSLSRSTLRFDSTGGTATFTVYSNTAWTINFPALVHSYSTSAGTGNMEVSVVLAPNPDEVAKIDTGIVADTYGVNQLFLTIVQESFIVELSVEPDDDITFVNTGSSSSVTIDCNADWEIEYPSWITPSVTSGSSGTTTVTFTADENGPTDRSGQITVYAGSKEVSINVYQPFYIPAVLTVTPSSWSFGYGEEGKTFIVNSYPEWSGSIVSTGETAWNTGCFIEVSYLIPSACTMSLYVGDKQGDVIGAYYNGVKQCSNTISFPAGGVYKVRYELTCGGQAPLLNETYILDEHSEGDIAPAPGNYIIAEYNVTSTGNTTVLTSYDSPGSNTNPITAATLEDGTSVMDQLKTNWYGSGVYYRAVQFPRTGKQTITYWYKDGVTSVGSQNTWHSVGALTKLELGSEIKSIPNERGCAYCGNLSAITFNGLTGTSPFWSYLQCGKLKTFVCKMTEEPTLDGGDFQGPGDYGTLYYPEGSDYSAMIAALNSTRDGFTTGWNAVPIRSESKYLTVTPSTTSFAYTGGSTTLSILSASRYVISTDASWITLSAEEGGVGGSSVTATVAINTGERRTGRITISNNTTTKYIDLTEAEGVITLSQTEISTFISATTTDITVLTPLPWSATPSQSWITVSPASGEAGSGTFTVNISRNETGANRNGFVTVQAGSSAETINILQRSCAPFVIKDHLTHFGYYGTDYYNIPSGKINISLCSYDFRGMTTIKYSNGGGPQGSKIAALGNTLMTLKTFEADCSTITRIDWPFEDSSPSYSYGSPLTTAIFHHTDNVTYLAGFKKNEQMTTIRFGSLAKLSSWANVFTRDNSGLTTFTVTALPDKNIDTNFGLNYCTNLSVDSLVSILNALPRTSASNRSIALGTTNKNKLTAEQLAIATDKGWSVI